MFNSLNKSTLIGRLGKDPEFFTFPSGGEKATFSLAVDDGYTDKNKKWVKKTLWVDIVVVSKGMVNHVRKHLSKGRMVHVEGKLDLRDFARQDGSKGRAIEIVVGSNGLVTVLDTSAKGGNQGQGNDQGGTAPAGGRQDTDDEIPF